MSREERVLSTHMLRSLLCLLLLLLFGGLLSLDAFLFSLLGSLLLLVVGERCAVRAAEVGREMAV